MIIIITMTGNDVISQLLNRQSLSSAFATISQRSPFSKEMVSITEVRALAGIMPLMMSSQW